MEKQRLIEYRSELYVYAIKNDTAYFINIDAYISGQMSKELDPVSISRLRHRTREPYVPNDCFH